MTNTEQTPLKPLANAPGSDQYRPPIRSLYRPEDGPPPQAKMTPAMTKSRATESLSTELQNSSSASRRSDRAKWR